MYRGDNNERELGGPQALPDNPDDPYGLSSPVPSGTAPTVAANFQTKSGGRLTTPPRCPMARPATDSKTSALTLSGHTKQP